MTNTHHRLPNAAELSNVLLGFDRIFNDSHIFGSTLEQGSYPRYNIVRVGEQGYRIEVAVPGWSKSDIEISLHKGILTVKGTRSEKETEGESYIRKGLSNKNFSRNFGVSEKVKLDRAYMERGLLCIDLHEDVPAEEKPLLIDIQ